MINIRQYLSNIYNLAQFTSAFEVIENFTQKVDNGFLYESRTLDADGDMVISDRVVQLDTSSSVVDYNLLPAEQWIGKEIIVKRQGINDGIIVADGSETIDGMGTYTLNTNDAVVRLISDGVEILIV